ncbi:hemicentin-1-like [Centropristis striata]|uniref:hemicentin-1-like n=1 Tax=Centropristis striata TaxID=184440 RepID=UPI0027E1D62A|nr:hemicentin-1-like [Centropristis striata]
MEKAVIHFILLGVISGLTKGAGVLPDGPLNATVGGTVMFTTTLTPHEHTIHSVSWIYGGIKPVFTFNVNNITAPEYEGRISFFMSTGSLELRNLALSDSGEYRVSIILPGQAPQLGNTRLDVYDPVSVPVVTASSTDLLEFNSSVRLSCSSSGSSLSFLWLNSSSEVTESDRVQLTDGGANLTVINVTRYDQGPFRCNVSNPVSEDTSEPINLSISYGPENIHFTKSPPQEYIEEGSDIIMTCSADSRPAAQFQWFLNGDLQSDTGKELILTNIQMNRSGNYSCQAFNSKTLRYETSQPAAVSVLERISGALIKPSSILAIEGNSFNLTCEALGSVFTREWKKRDSDLILTEDMTLHDNNRVLSFSSLNKKHREIYDCIVSNPLGSKKALYILDVQYGPDNVQITGLHEIKLKGSLELECSADSVPRATYIWKLNGTEIDTSYVFTKDNAEFNDSGSYICEATNAITERTSSSAVHELSVTEELPVVTSGCSGGCIAGIVIAVLVVCAAAAGGGGFYFYKKKINNKPLPHSGNKEEMEKAVIHFVILGVISGLTKGAGVLPDDLLNAAVGGTVMFTTTLTPHEHTILTVSWIYGGNKPVFTFTGNNITEPEYEGRITFFMSTGSLELRNLALSDSGVYSVSIILDGQPPLAGNTRLDVYVPVSVPVVTASSTDLLEFNSSVRLSCSSSGSSLSFLWLNSSSEVTESDRVQLTDGNSTLNITNVTRYDQGPFRCKVSNPVSEDTSEPINLSISYGPENIHLTTSPPQEYYAEGSDINMTCSADSRPAAQFQWFLNGELQSDTGPELRLIHIQMNQSGNYICQAFNSRTLRYETSQPAAVSVLNMLHNVDGPENINLTKSPPQEYYADGSDITLTCSADSRPAAQFQWFLNGELQSDTGPELRLINIQMSQSGNYSCQAFNSKTLRSLMSQPSVVSVLEELPVVTSGCSGGCIAGIVIAVLVVCAAAAGGGGFYFYKKKINNKPLPHSGNKDEMEISVIHIIILGVISELSPPGLTKGAGVLQDDLLNAAVGGTVMFTTTLTPHEQTFQSVSWIYGGIKPVFTFNVNNITAPEYEGRISFFMSTGSLELRNLALSDSGEYSVIIGLAGQLPLLGNTRLDVYDPVSVPVVTASSTDLLEFNSSVRLSCSSSGSSLSFLWLNSSSEVTESDRVQLTDGGANLTITNVTRYDQGPFRCNVSNPVSEDTSEPINLSISYGPENIHLTKSPPQEYYAEGSDITLTCSADSRPAAQFQWFLNGELQSDTGPELRLINIQMSQTGNYSCQTFNSKTLRSLMSQPSVVSVLERISGALIKPSSILAIEGNSFNLTCEALGSVFTREWKKRDSDLILTEDMTLHDNNRVLSFSSLNKKHREIYDCIISNPLGSDEALYILDVKYGPDNVQIAGLHEIKFKGPLELECSADSVPRATYIWKLNGTEIDTSYAFTKDNAEFNDSGSYVCEATNAITGRTSSSAVHELSVTEEPQVVVVEGCSGGCIAGIVIAICAVVGGGGYYFYKKK